MRLKPPALKHWPVIAVSSLIALSIVLIGAAFFVRSRDIMQEEIKMRLRSTAAAAALAIDGDLLEAIQGPLDMELPEYVRLSDTLRQIRNLPGIRFAYILRRTDNPMVLTFVADADTLLAPEELDINGNGRVDVNEEPSYPGEYYDASAIVPLQGEAFMQATTDRKVTFDQWGPTISGYAPIYDNSGRVVAAIGIDMSAETFFRSSQSIFSPILLFLNFAGGLMIAALAAIYAERRQLLMLKKINDERSGLLRLTFHQIGEPLTIMKWSLETLRDGTEHPHLKNLVEDHLLVMDEGLGRLNSIIDTLQLAEKVDIGTLEYVAVPSSLKSIVENAANEWGSSLQKRKQRLNIDMVDRDIHLSIDRMLISLVLRQLFMNAIEYSHEGGDINVRVRREHRHVHITVEDQGCGIPKEDLPKLFEKYRRASNAHLKKPDGNGLGLYIAKGIIEKGGGTIWVESIEGSGTKVSFTLPAQ